MSIFTRLGLAALFAAFLLSAPLHAHEGHQDNMSDAEMLAMEEGMAMPDDAYAGELAPPMAASPTGASWPRICFNAL